MCWMQPSPVQDALIGASTCRYRIAAAVRRFLAFMRELDLWILRSIWRHGLAGHRVFPVLSWPT